jgi:hypothetical protein
MGGDLLMGWKNSSSGRAKGSERHGEAKSFSWIHHGTSKRLAGEVSLHLFPSKSVWGHAESELVLCWSRIALQKARFPVVPAFFQGMASGAIHNQRRACQGRV